MRIRAAHPNFIMPIRGSKAAGGWDLAMPEAGEANGTVKMVDLGFQSAIPPGYVALLLPRSGVGAKKGVELNNTCGVIDADYRGNWKAAIKTKSGIPFSWEAGERVIQAVIVPVYTGELELVDELDETERGAGGFGSTGA